MSMICSRCGGRVVWRGPLTALTHTECKMCGAVNAQLSDEAQDDADSDEARDMVSTHAAAFVERTQAEIAALLGKHAAAVGEFAVHMHNRVRRAEAVADALAASSCALDAQADRLTISGATPLLAALNLYRSHKGI